MTACEWTISTPDRPGRTGGLAGTGRYCWRSRWHRSDGGRDGVCCSDSSISWSCSRPAPAWWSTGDPSPASPTRSASFAHRRPRLAFECCPSLWVEKREYYWVVGKSNYGKISMGRLLASYCWKIVGREEALFNSISRISSTSIICINSIIG